MSSEAVGIAWEKIQLGFTWIHLDFTWTEGVSKNILGLDPPSLKLRRGGKVWKGLEQDRKTRKKDFTEAREGNEEGFEPCKAEKSLKALFGFSRFY